MNQTLSVLLLFVLISSTVARGQAVRTWTDPSKAAAEDNDFLLQGEYVGETSSGKCGVQLAACGKGKFICTLLKGGLPGAGGDAKDRETCTGVTEDGKTIILKGANLKKALIENGVLKLIGADDKTLGEFKKVERTSPTLGAKAPEGALVLFDGSNTDQFKGGKMDGKLLCEATSTNQKFKSFQLHLEFWMPYKPERFPSHQDRGNSGIYTYNRYETQLLDSFGLHYDHFGNDWKAKFQEELDVAPNSDRMQWCAAFYKFKAPDINMCFPPLTWQTYDIDFTAPQFEGEKKVKNARITVRHNGVVVQNDVEMVQGGTGAGRGKAEVSEGEIFLQGHGNPVRFQNLWIVEKK